jgi:hypothetical protein
MLLEIRCSVFRTGFVEFRLGLNVVLGDDNATNSIGKSTLLMIVDFVLGGSTLLSHNADLVTELGHHDYHYAFRFGEEIYRFKRGTHEPTVIYVCDELYEPTRGINLEEFTAILKQSYSIALPDLSFRALIGLYLRVWGKENLFVERPLHVAHGQAPRECVDNLVKTFGRYDAIRDLAGELATSESEVKAWKAATRHGIVPAVGKSEHSNNQKRLTQLEGELADIRANLAKYATNLSAIVNKEVLHLKLEKDRLLDLRLTIAGRLERVRRNLQENRQIRSASFRDLEKFFPEINQDRLARVEEFHRGVSKLLRLELKESDEQLTQEVERIDAGIRNIDDEMARTLSSVDEPGVLVDRVYEVAVALDDARKVNERFESETSLRANAKSLRAQLEEEKEKVLAIVQAVANDGMRRIVSSVFGEEHKSPRLSLRDNSYTFDVYDDTGTGTAYANLVVFDLAIFLATQLPVVAHDSLLFKNIENDSVARLLQVYLTTEKQSFIAIDEIEKYGRETADLLRERSVIQLDDQNVLYVKDWRT